MTEDKTITSLATKEESSPSLFINTITTESDGSSTSTQFVVDDAELLSILADPSDTTSNHANVSNLDTRIQTPTVAILDWEDWNQDVPEFPDDNNNNSTSSKKRKRGDTPLESDDDEDDDEFNFLDQLDFVDATFDSTTTNIDSGMTVSLDAATTTTTTTTDNNNSKKQKTNNFVNDNMADLSSLLKQSDSLIDDLDYRWVLDITS